MKRLLPLALICLAALVTTATVSAQAAEKPASGSRPNIIVIMSDDMGISDIGCYGGEIQTPTLNRLADDGLRFKQFYNTARCCSTRAALLTGLYSHQAGIGHMTSDNGVDGYRGDLAPSCVTIAEALRPTGYSTYMSGKWHVTKNIHEDGSKDNWPIQRGFDRFYGIVTGAASFFDPISLCRDNTLITPINDADYQPETYYFTDAISDNAVKYIADHEKSDPDKPFFMYVAYTAAHWPMHALPEDIAKYKGRYDAGWDELRKERHQRMIDIGLIDPSWDITPRDEKSPAWDSLDAEEKAWRASLMEVYAAMIDNMDQGIGRIVAELEKTGQLDNTLIMFLQDNGACAESYGSFGPITPKDLTIRAEPKGPDALQREMTPKFTRDGRPVKRGQGVIPGPDDTAIGYTLSWANASNTPFRLYKHWEHEGGISSPLIVHWPDQVNRTGQWESSPSHLIDLMATCVDVAGAEYPKQRDGVDVTPLEGLSLVPAFQGVGLDRDTLYWEHEGNRAVRVGDWKLVAAGGTGPWELYNLKTDRTEMHNLAADQPERVEQMAAKWQAWAERAQVLPLTPYYKNRNNSSSYNKKQMKFELKPDTELMADKSPYVVNRGIKITTTIPAQTTDGVIVAQGGSASGWSFYLKDRTPVFATTVDGQCSEAPVGAKLHDSDVKVQLTLTKSGDISLSVTDSKTLGTYGKFQLLNSQPLDGLSVGQDPNGNAGNYTVPNAANGPVNDVTLELIK